MYRHNDKEIKNACRDGSRLGAISKNECEVSGGSIDIRNNGKCVIIGTSINNKEYGRRKKEEGREREACAML